MIRFVFILLFLIVSTTTVIAQETLSQDEVEELQSMSIKAKGTYQIQMIDTRSLPTIPLSLIKEIEKNRNDNEIVYLNINSNMRIKILSRTMINKNDFVLIDQIVYISSNEL